MKLGMFDRLCCSACCTTLVTRFRASAQQFGRVRHGCLQFIARHEDLKADIRAEVEMKLSNLEESRKRIEVQDRTICTAGRRYEITLLRLREGIGSQLELSEAELQPNKVLCRTVKSANEL